MQGTDADHDGGFLGWGRSCCLIYMSLARCFRNEYQHDAFALRNEAVKPHFTHSHCQCGLPTPTPRIADSTQASIGLGGYGEHKPWYI